MELGKKAKQYNINIDEAIGIHTYMGSGYKEINNYLRDKVKSDYEKGRRRVDINNMTTQELKDLTNFYQSTLILKK